jgi:hypothetical protein
MSATVGVLDCAAKFAMALRTRAGASRCSAVQKGVDKLVFQKQPVQSVELAHKLNKPGFAYFRITHGTVQVS